jgi:hypothetical protein
MSQYGFCEITIYDVEAGEEQFLTEVCPYGVDSISFTEARGQTAPYYMITTETLWMNTHTDYWSEMTKTIEDKYPDVLVAVDFFPVITLDGEQIYTNEDDECECICLNCNKQFYEDEEFCLECITLTDKEKEIIAKWKVGDPIEAGIEEKAGMTYRKIIDEREGAIMLANNWTFEQMRKEVYGEVAS